VSNELPVDFGRVEVGSMISKQFLLRNQGTRALALTRVSASGGGFALAQPPQVAILEPGVELAIEVELRPIRAEVAQGVLEINSRRFQLVGNAVLPRLPDAVIEIEPLLESGHQVPIHVRLTGAAPIGLTATLTLRFEPADGLPDDPAVQLLPGGGRTARLTIAAGESVARWRVADSGALQTGTTAGMVRLVLEIGGREQEWSTPISRAPVRIDIVRAVRTPNGIEVTVDGFDNTRTLSEGVFRFFDSRGALVDPEGSRVFLRDLFARYFAGSDAGGLFRLHVRFPVIGDAAAISAVEVELVNSQAVSRAGRVTF
jgi:hypothetical protein